MMNPSTRLERAEQAIAARRPAHAGPLSPPAIATDLANCVEYFESFCAANAAQADPRTVADWTRAIRLMNQVKAGQS